MLINHFWAIMIAWLIDQWLGDPPHWPHPVKWFGRMIAFFDCRLNKGNYKAVKGFIMVIFLSGCLFCLSFLLVEYVYRTFPPYVGIVLESLLIAPTIAQKGLKDAALSVLHPLKRGDLQTARAQLAYIVGRDTNHLNEAEITRGTVETVAENINDGITAPMFWVLIGGAPFALVYRLINTCDSMVGYKNDMYIDFGRASAMIDDIVNFIPARLTGIAIMCAKKPLHTSYVDAWTIVRRDAKKHASPNSGWGEVSVAAILGVQLGGVNYYAGQRSKGQKLGVPRVPLNVQHISLTISIMKRAVFIFLVGGLFIAITVTWVKSSLCL